MGAIRGGGDLRACLAGQGRQGPEERGEKGRGWGEGGLQEILTLFPPPPSGSVAGGPCAIVTHN